MLRWRSCGTRDDDVAHDRFHVSCLCRTCAARPDPPHHVIRVVIALAFLPALAGGAPVTCDRTRGFHDGDTFACVPADGPAFVVRVAGLDAPEVGQAHWRPSRDRLRTLAGPGTQVACYKTDRYGREVWRGRGTQGFDVVERLIGAGLAWHGTRYADEQTPDEQRRYAAAETAARAERLGIWSQSEPMTPWDCRARRKERRGCR
jgi:endonuclease YncB( thermonuclease family)